MHVEAPDSSRHVVRHDTEKNVPSGLVKSILIR